MEESSTTLLWGATGWMGGMIAKEIECIAAKSRLEAIDETEAELDRVKPSRVIVAAALTGRPTVDWCEDHKAEVLATNYAGTLELCRACARRGIHCTLLGSGCIYQYDMEHPNCEDDARGFGEKDAPNFKGSFYSRTKLALERDLGALGLLEKDVLVLRIRMPVLGDKSPRCLLTKLGKYKDHVVDGMFNSITFLPDMIGTIPKLSQAKIAGLLNFCQPGAVTNREIVEIALGDEGFTFVSPEALPKLTRAPRSNCVLNCSRLSSVMRDLGLPPLRTAKECLMSLR